MQIMKHTLVTLLHTELELSIWLTNFLKFILDYSLSYTTVFLYLGNQYLLKVLSIAI